MSGPALQRFMTVVTWHDREAFADLLSVYVNALAERLAHILARIGLGPGDKTAALVDEIERSQPHGLVSALTWPPISAALLGRLNEDSNGCGIDDLLRSRAITPISAGAPLVVEPPWLGTRAPGHAASPTDRRQAERNLAPARTLVERFGENVSDVVTTCTRVVVLRSSPGGAEIGSWSTDELVGCTVLVNAHTAKASTAFLAECLVHEAIHHCQGMLEVKQPLIRDASLVARPERYASPWSGAMLTAKSFLAACFVWFSLAHLWERAPTTVDEATRRRHLSRAVRGFVAGDPAGIVAGFGRGLDHDVHNAVATMQDAVRRQWG